ncbi:hypothetical protein CWI37_0063p0010 [Hamiltosporidium tvaerminnensis]|uniref:Reverse transcriptase domain-containing protein n=1 Tax=Hamiltosporidium tvaerminnensis TaxID=1176355 RepID=A0A4V2JVU3_9MICR|nr:hypothetical protein CWI37_0063p0010 [Hamiltosporidium tvaerminnensis]
MGANRCTKAKEQAQRNATWIDVKKASDLIDHSYLKRGIENTNLPDWIPKFIRKVLQRESLSPLLFVLCMDPLSQIPRKKYTKETIQTDAESQTNNHIFLLSDLKLFGFDKIFEGDWLGNQQREDSTNALYCEDTVTFLIRKVSSDTFKEYKRKSLEEAQLTKLYNKIEKLKLHSKLYNARRNELVGVSDSSRWPKKGNIGPRNEAMFYYCHDRNLIREADERACRDKSEHQNKNDVKIRCNRSQIFISEKIKKMIPLIEVEIRNDEDSVNHLKTKNNTLYMLEGGTKFVEPTINLNEESDLEEKTGVKDIGENI